MEHFWKRGVLVHVFFIARIHCNRLQGTYRETGEHMEKLFHLQGIPVPWTGSWLFSILWYREWLLELQGMTVGGTGGLQGNKWTQGKTVSPTVDLSCSALAHPAAMGQFSRCRCGFLLLCAPTFSYIKRGFWSFSPSSTWVHFMIFVPLDSS